MTHQLLNLEAAAKFLATDVKDLRSRAMAAEIPCIRQGERLMFDQSELELWLSQQMVLQKKDTRSFSRQAMADRELNLADFCCLEGISCELDGKTKTAVLKNLVGLAEKTGYLYSPEELFEQIKNREEQGSTAMENGIALVHPAERVEFLAEKNFICIAKTKNPVFFGEANGKPTDIFILIVCEDGNLHVRILGKICQLFLDTNLAEKLHNATLPEEIMQIISEL